VNGLRDLAGKRESLAEHPLVSAIRRGRDQMPGQGTGTLAREMAVRHSSTGLSIPNLVYSSMVFSSIVGQKWVTTSSDVEFDLESVVTTGISSFAVVVAVDITSFYGLSFGQRIAEAADVGRQCCICRSQI
jgi:hypothetical protein